MAWTAPVTRSTGTMVTAAIWNTAIVDNPLYLKAHEAFTGLIAIAVAACPAGWTRVSTWDGKFVRGASAYGATGGSDTHNHTSPNHAHTIAIHKHSLTWGAASYTYGPPVVFTSAVDKNLLASTGAGSARGAITLISDGSGDTGTTGGGAMGYTSSFPEYIEVVFCKKD